jgi:hypothetical protein
MSTPTVLARMIVVVPFFALAAAGKTPVSNWDDVQKLPPGTEVRVAAGAEKALTGTLEGVTDTTLSILSVGAGRQSIEKTQIVSLSVKKPGRRLRHTLIGLGVGLVVGTAEGLAAGNCSAGCKANQSLTAYSIAGGAFWGALVGAAWPAGGWRKVYMR